MKNGMVIYHGNCVDGYTAAWAAWRRFGDKDTEYIAANHGDAPPDVTGKKVLIVDFSYPREELIEMQKKSSWLWVYDHHKTAQTDLQDLHFATFDMNKSGAGITWDELHKGVTRPWLVDYVEDRDLWKFSLMQSKEVNAWVGAQPRENFDSWTHLWKEGVDTSADRGMAVLMFVNSYVQNMSKQARMTEFEGAQVPVVNAPYINTSELVGYLSLSHPFAVGWFMRSDGKYVYSLRSSPTGVDVSAIAKKYGGGGHEHSAGFQLDTFIFTFKT